MGRILYRLLPCVFLLLTACGGGNSAASDLSSPATTTTTTTTEQALVNPGVGLPGIVSLTISPTFSVVKVGESIQLIAIGTFEDGSSREVTSEISWLAVGDGTVNDTGLVTGTSVGGISIAASDWENTSVGAGAIVTVSLYRIEGSLDQPVVLTVDQPHQGEVSDGGSADGFSYYRVAVTQGETYYIRLTDLLADANLRVYSDAAYSNLLCESVNYAEYDELCVISDTTLDELFVLVDGNQTVFTDGTTYTLHVQRGYDNRGTRDNPVAVELNAPFEAEVGLGTSTYAVPVAYSGKYTIRLSNLTDNVDIIVIDQYSTVKCWPVDAGGTNDESCQVQADVDTLYILAISNNTTIGAAFTLTVTEDHPAYTSEGTSTAPVDVTNSLPYSGQVGQKYVTSSYYAVSVTPGKSYIVSLTNLDAYAGFTVYNGDGSFTTPSCHSEGHIDHVCRIEPAAGNTLYIKVDGNDFGADYTLNVTEIVYLAEGTQATPKLVSPEPTSYTDPHAGQVDSVASYYQLPVTAGALYHVGASKLSGNIGLEVYDSDFSTLLCSSDNADLTDEGCQTTSTTSGTTLYIVITGSIYGSRFDLNVDRVYRPVGSPAAPVDITGQLPFTTETGPTVDLTQQSYYKVSLTPGKSYRFSVTDFSHPDISLMVYDEDPSDFSDFNYCHAAQYSGNYTCTITPVTSVSGVVYLRARAVNTLYGAGFTINIEEIAYQSEGTSDSPVVVGNFPVPYDSYGTVLQNNLLSYNGETGVGSSYYVADISGGYDYVGYRVNLTNQGSDADLYVYDDAGFSNLLCVSSNGSSNDESCAISTASNQLYIRVDGAPSGFGAVYTLEVDQDYQSEGSPVTGKGKKTTGGALELSLAISHPGEADNIDASYYQVPVTAGVSYTIGLSNLFNSACIRTYPDDDGTFTSSSGPYDTHNGLNDKTLTVTPNSDVLYFKIVSCSYPATNGTAYTVEINPSP